MANLSMRICISSVKIGAGRLADGSFRVPPRRSHHRSRLQPIPGAENPSQDRQARRDEQRGEAEARGDADVALAEKAPAKAADEVDNWVEQADRAPELRQHVDPIVKASRGSGRPGD